MSFTAKQTSSDGGLLLLREVESKIGILKSITDCIVDTRHPGYVQHTINSMLTQRVLQIAAGYEDGNDCDTLGDDMILKICAGVSPEEDKSLSSQPTMSRFENSISRKELYNMGFAFIDRFINSYSKEYCARGQMELYIKEHKTYLNSDKMSCSSFEANQFRLFMHSAAYVLMHTLRTEFLADTEYATATMKTIRLRLIKVAAYVKGMKTRIRIEFPKQFPDLTVIANCLTRFEMLRC